MKRVTGIGGIFFRSNKPRNLQEWYAKHLGMKPDSDNTITLKWREKEDPNKLAHTVWAPFPEDTEYFDKSFMLNFRVEDLDALLAVLRQEGVEVLDKTFEDANGKFGFIVDPEGRKVQLWEPAKETFEKWPE